MTDTVGAVYVRVMSDSRGFAKELRTVGEKGGNRASKAFSKAFHDGAVKDLNKLNLERYLTPKIGNWAKDYVKQVKIAEAAGKDLDINFAIGQIVSDDELQKLHERLGVPFAQIARYVRKEIPKAARSGFADVDRESAAAARKQKARDKERVDFWLKEMKRIRPLSDVWSNTNFRNVLWRLGDDLQKIVTPAMRDALKEGGRVDWLDTADGEARIRRLANTYRISFADAERAVRKEMQRTMQERDAALGWFAKMRRSMRAMANDSKVLDKRVKGIYQSFRRMGTGGAFDTITTLFGGIIRGSFLAGKAFVSLGSLAGSALENIGDMVTEASKKMGRLEGLVSGVGGAMASIGQAIASSLSSGIAGIAVLAAAAVALVSVLGAVAQVLSAIVALIVAAGSAMYYVVSQAALLVPILGALGLGFAAVAVGGWDAAKSVGLLVKAMNETDPKKRAEAMDEYVDSLKDLGPAARDAVKALRPLIEGFAGFKKEVGERLFEGMAASIKRAQPLIDKFKTGLLEIADAAGDVIKAFLDLGADTKFVEDFNTMMTLSAGLVRDLGTAAADVFAGLNSFFAAMAPVVKLFGEDIKGIAASFKEWAQSESGQAAILEFFTTAREMGKLFWGVLKEAGGALHDLFTDPATVEAAKGLLTWITEKIQEFRKWIAEASEDGRLAEWFDNAKQVGLVLWDVMMGLVGAFKALLTPESITTLKLIGAWFLSWVNAIVLVVRIVGTLAWAFSMAFSIIKNAVLWIINGWKLIWDAVSSAVKKFNDARNAGKSMGDALKAAFNGVREAWNRFLERLRSIRWPTPPAWLSKAWGLITGSNKAAAGGLFMGPTQRLIGEEGPEVVIPLHRPLSRVDPSVRNMAAMMRGGAGPGGGTVNSRTMTNYWTVTSPSPDGRVVASQIVNRMAAMAS